MRKKRIILVGHGASGKDYARKLLSEAGFSYGVSYTTRPPRENETDGVDYHFLSVETFEELIEEDFWYEFVPFNGWYYGTSNEQFYEDSNLFIMTPKGLAHVNEKDRSESLVFFFDIDEETRKERMAGRKGNADSIERRLEADRIDFEDFTDYDVHITSPTYDLGDLMEPIRKSMATKLVQRT